MQNNMQKNKCQREIFLNYLVFVIILNTNIHKKQPIRFQSGIKSVVLFS